MKNIENLYTASRIARGSPYTPLYFSILLMSYPEKYRGLYTTLYMYS